MTDMMIRKTFLTLMLALFVLAGRAQLMTGATNPQGQIKAEVSETVELMAVLSRTSGYQEYCMDQAGQYTKDTEAWFAEYKNHPIIAYYQDIRAKHDISHDAVMTMAIHLEIDKGKVKFIGEKADLGKRWENVDVDAFVDQLNKFYKDTRFRQFFEQHQAFYNDGLKSYETNVLQFFHQEWYSRFYGTEPVEQFRIIIGFGNGGHSYGPNRQLPGQPKEVFSICGYCLNPTTGQPFWDAAVLIHEFNHSFVNPLLDNPTNAAMMEKVGQKLLQFSQPEMESQAYNDWHTVINESIVRAAVYIYMREYGLVNRGTTNFLFEEVWRKGFRWTPELVAALQNYTANRGQYKTLNDFYPEIAACLTEYVKKETERLQKVLQP